MTNIQERLLNRARDYWVAGHQLPIDLYAQLAEAGMDVPKLEQMYLKEEV
jgi:hypothetical protein